MLVLYVAAIWLLVGCELVRSCLPQSGGYRDFLALHWAARHAFLAIMLVCAPIIALIAISYALIDGWKKGWNRGR